MFFCSVEASEYFHHIVNLLLFFGPSLIQSYLFPQIQQFPANDKLFPLDPFIKLMIVDIYESKLHSFFFLGIIIVKLHLC